MAMSALLKNLVQLENDQPVTGEIPDFYAILPTHYVCHVTMAGKVSKIERVQVTENGKDIPVTMAAPSVRRGNAPLPLLLADGPEYVYGFTTDDAKRDRVDLYRRMFCEQAIRCAKATNLPEVSAVAAALSAGLPVPDGIKPGDRTVFSVNGKIVTDLPKVRQYWADQQTERVDGGSPTKCLVCGQLRKPMRVLTEPVKGVPESQGKRCSLVSANAESTWKFGRGKNSSAIPPLCHACARDSHRALNRLIATKTSRVIVGNVILLWWLDPAPTAEELYPLRELLLTPDVANVGQPERWDGANLHVLLLAARKSRGIVLDYRVSPAQDVLRRLGSWRDMQMKELGKAVPVVSNLQEENATKAGKAVKVKVWRNGLVNSLHPAWNDKRVAPTAIKQIVCAVLYGEPLLSLEPAAAARVNLLKDDNTTDGCNKLIVASALLKLCEKGENVSNGIPVTDTVPYRCGELLAVLERIQKAAVVGITRTVADRCLRSAATSPSVILGRALLDAQRHLQKLQKTHRDQLFRDALNEVTNGLEFPSRFDASEQANFVLGYFTKRNAK